MQTSDSARIRTGAVLLGISALLSVAFPLVRPFFADPDMSSPESLAIAAKGFTASAWVAAHLMAMIGFVLLIFGMMTLYAYLSESKVERRAFQAMILSLSGIGLVLPSLGVELYTLPMIGRLYLDGNADVFNLMGAIRMEPVSALVFLIGLLLLAIGGIVLAVAIWQSEVLPKWAGVAFAIGLALYLPVFPHVIRIVDGLLIGIGGMGLAWSIWRKTAGADDEAPTGV